MTAKEALMERVGQLSEEDAAEWLARIEWESTEFEELTAEEQAAVSKSDEEYRRGEALDGDRLLHELGL
jgi:hypothetical protein